LVGIVLEKSSRAEAGILIIDWDRYRNHCEGNIEYIKNGEEFLSSKILLGDVADRTLLQTCLKAHLWKNYETINTVPSQSHKAFVQSHVVPFDPFLSRNVLETLKYEKIHWIKNLSFGDSSPIYDRHVWQLSKYFINIKGTTTLMFPQLYCEQKFLCLNSCSNRDDLKKELEALVFKDQVTSVLHGKYYIQPLFQYKHDRIYIYIPHSDIVYTYTCTCMHI
jgi:hypothetical protein